MNLGLWISIVAAILWYNRNAIARARFPGRNSGREKTSRAARQLANNNAAYSFRIRRLVLFISKIHLLLLRENSWGDEGHTDSFRRDRTSSC